VKHFLVAVLGIAPPVLVGLWAGRRVEHRPSVDPGVEANARLIGYASLWFLAITVHVAAYCRRAPELAVADWRRRMGGAGGRRSVVVASLLVGAALVLAMLPFPSPFTPLAGAG
jgi:hypothetical protein